MIKIYNNIVTISLCNTTCFAIATVWNLYDILKLCDFKYIKICLDKKASFYSDIFSGIHLA